MTIYKLVIKVDIHWILGGCSTIEIHINVQNVDLNERPQLLYSFSINFFSILLCGSISHSLPFDETLTTKPTSIKKKLNESNFSLDFFSRQSYKRSFVLKKAKKVLKSSRQCITSNSSKLYYFNPNWSNALSRNLRLIYTFWRLDFVYRIASWYGRQRLK